MQFCRIRSAFAASVVAAGASAVLAGCAGGRRATEPPIISASGTRSVYQALDQFRTLLGGPINVGRREINWDGVPAALTNTNTFPGNFFNTTSARGALLSTPGTGFRVSNTNFADVNTTYGSQFGPLSITKTFSPIGSNITDVTFEVAGTPGAVAGVHGFGAVFSDVDKSTSTKIEFFDEGGRSLGVFAAPPKSDATNLSFLGVYFPETLVTRVRITAGEGAIGAAVNDISNGGTLDLVVMDDFLYSEPQAIF